MTAVNDGAPAGVDYRERLSPSLWVLVSAAVCGPMAALVLVPIAATISLAVGIAVSVGLVALLVAISPVVEIRDGMLRAGRARIPVQLLRAGAAFEGDAARSARGAGLDPRAWHLLRGGIDQVVVIPVEDPDDPTPYWIVSSRTPDRLAAALRRAQVRLSTPRR